MKLLIVTQAVDANDPALGFFVRWIEEFSKHVESIEVICLKEGKHDALPANVRVHSLGKEKNPPRFARRLMYAVRFKWLAWRLRHDYDAVFVHMNEEYILIAGPLWRLLGKRIYLWRNHARGSWSTVLVVALSNKVFCTSKQSYTARFNKTVLMPIGVDTERFVSKVPEERQTGSILFLGRLDPVKHPDLFAAACATLPSDATREVHVYGDPTPGNEAYADNLKRQYATVSNLSFHAGVSNEAAASLYRTHDIYVNLTTSGSFDKTIGEAMASGCIVVCANEALRGVVPDARIVSDTIESVQSGIKGALALSEKDREREHTIMREYVVRKHSLEKLCANLFIELI